MEEFVINGLPSRKPFRPESASGTANPAVLQLQERKKSLSAEDATHERQDVACKGVSGNEEKWAGSKREEAQGSAQAGKRKCWEKPTGEVSDGISNEYRIAETAVDSVGEKREEEVAQRTVSFEDVGVDSCLPESQPLKLARRMHSDSVNVANSCSLPIATSPGGTENATQEQPQSSTAEVTGDVVKPVSPMAGEGSSAVQEGKLRSSETTPGAQTLIPLSPPLKKGSTSKEESPHSTANHGETSKALVIRSALAVSEQPGRDSLIVSGQSKQASMPMRTAVRPKTIRDFPVRKNPTSPPIIAIRQSIAIQEPSITPSSGAQSLLPALKTESSKEVEEKATEADKPSDQYFEAPPSQEELNNKEEHKKEKVNEGKARQSRGKGKRKAKGAQGGSPLAAKQSCLKKSLADEGAEAIKNEFREGWKDRLMTEEEWAEASLKVRQALREYNALRRHLMQEENIPRPDLRAGTIMREKGKALNDVDEKGQKVQIFGTVPGVPVGMQFYFRQEMVVIGLHCQTQAGIDWLQAQRSRFKMEIATGVIASGGYEDDLDHGEWFDYTGQGGNNYKTDKKQSCNQEMVRGNLALKNSCELGFPVRVIRGSPERNSENGVVYTYDGLYKVESWRETKGESGHRVYKFRLVRLPGQPPLSSSQVEFVRTSFRSDMKIQERKGVVVEDISEGQERVPICCVNTIDDPPVPPPEFRYSSKVVYSPSIDTSAIKPHTGCDCKGSCSDASKCACARLNKGRFPYTKNGLLVELQTAVFECGPNCGCACQKQMCCNRVAQNGLRYRFEIFKTASKGWAVRSWDAIPAGAFICEYTGMLYTDEEAEKLRDNDEYLYNLDYVKGNQDRWGDVSGLLGHGRASLDVCELEESKFCVDAKEVGNLARFINHSCEPNLVMQCVFYDHLDMRLPHLMLFAADSIPPLKELTYDYNYTIGGVVDANGNPKSLACHCGTTSCRLRLY